MERGHLRRYGCDGLEMRACKGRVTAVERLRSLLRAAGHRLRRRGWELRCGSCGAIVAFSRLGPWLATTPCPGQQVARDGRLCFAANPYTVAARIAVGARGGGAATAPETAKIEAVAEGPSLGGNR